ncbi:hypothetical protein M9H77_31446 [Catharanthus roseus]|uniref:Uncharacterized protein n=1 Tax=Catharanthus roseus TaxID=4058 RepID=A0ACC0A0Z6_CATRO|nr:hypothetical protein M9H77_31446 [Catharanthus roseus]
MNQESQEAKGLLNGLCTSARLKKLKALEDNGMIVYMMEALKSKLEGFEGQEKMYKLFSKFSICKDQTRNTLEEKMAKFWHGSTLVLTLSVSGGLLLDIVIQVIFTDFIQGVYRVLVLDSINSMNQPLVGIARIKASYHDLELLHDNFSFGFLVANFSSICASMWSKIHIFFGSFAVLLAVHLVVASGPPLDRVFCEIPEAWAGHPGRLLVTRATVQLAPS